MEIYDVQRNTNSIIPSSILLYSPNVTWENTVKKI